VEGAFLSFPFPFFFSLTSSSVDNPLFLPFRQPLRPEQLYDLLFKIPAGKISTYGQIATLLSSSPRAGESSVPFVASLLPPPSTTVLSLCHMVIVTTLGRCLLILSSFSSPLLSRFRPSQQPLRSNNPLPPRPRLKALHRRLRRRMAQREQGRRAVQAGSEGQGEVGVAEEGGC
jgi:hypothetical protein